VRDVWGECQREYVRAVETCGRVIKRDYGEVVMQFGVGDVNDAFAKRS
jgi:hypothetical protein